MTLDPPLSEWISCKWCSRISSLFCSRLV